MTIEKGDNTNCLWETSNTPHDSTRVGWGMILDGNSEARKRRTSGNEMRRKIIIEQEKKKRRQ